ncbi:MAG TPA: hypothetical protein PKK78_02940 [Kouleothrix sp.]|jgi:hypothetical protein|nr:hypothetical protein [Kouleothrix sp.]
MLRVTEQVDTSYLEQPTPRPRPTGVMLNLFYDYMLERPLRTLLNPLSITCLVALIVLYLLRVPPLVRLIPLLILLGQLGLAARQIWRRVRDDMALLSNGLIVRAHVMRLRPHRNPTGAIEGALLDCAIPVAPRRTYMGSIWISDGDEALRLANQGRLAVLCLPRTPGTWRVLEGTTADIRYDRMGPVQSIPADV